MERRSKPRKTASVTTRKTPSRRGGSSVKYHARAVAKKFAPVFRKLRYQ